MPRLPRFLAPLALTLVGASAFADVATTQPAGRVEVEPAVTIRVTQVAGGPRGGTVGDLVEYDDEGLTIVVGEQRRNFRWIELTPHSAFTARYRLIDQNEADDWLQLAEFAWMIGAEPEAEKSLRWALRLDPTLAADVERIRSRPPGELRGPFQEQQEDEGSVFAGEGRELLADSQGRSSLVEPVTPEQAARAVAAADEAAGRELRKLGMKPRRLETDHFIIYTDWDLADDELLSSALEDAYRLVAGEFGIPLFEDVFVGKLPVYMFNEHELFMRYAREIDGHRQFSNTVAGYYTGRSDGMGKMVMSKPRQLELYGPQVATQIWRRNLTHEFSHAFFARYRSNAFVPRWLNEGLAEVIAERVHPRPGAINTARRAASSSQSISRIFDDRVTAGPEMYPVMMTLVKALHDEDPQRFVQFIDRIKAGENAENVLRDLYDVDYRGLEAAWRRLMLQK
jgi:hypothetical protein